jgi:ketosteroid isomerase-like protein
MTLPNSLYEIPRSLLSLHVALVRRPRPKSQDLETRVARLEAVVDIQRILHQYAYSYDAGDIEAMMEIYSDDCLLVNGSGTYAGAEAIRSNYLEAISARETAFHHLADVEIATSEDVAEAWATGYLHNLAVRDGNAGGTMASCVFHLRRFEDAWRVIECRIVVSNQHGYAPPHPRTPTPSLARPSSPETVAALVDL